MSEHVPTAAAEAALDILTQDLSPEKVKAVKAVGVVAINDLQESNILEAAKVYAGSAVDEVSLPLYLRPFRSLLKAKAVELAANAVTESIAWVKT